MLCQRGISIWEAVEIVGFADVLRSLIGFVLQDQEYCTICGGSFEKGGSIDICAECLDKLSLIGAYVCERCGCPLCSDMLKVSQEKKTLMRSIYDFFNDEKLICSDCLSQKQAVKSRSPLIYQGYVRELILSFKFDGRYTLAEPFSQIMAQYMLEAKPFGRIDCITYVPLYTRKLEERGYNQSELLSKGVSRRLSIPVIQGLVRVSEGKPQSLTEKKERRANIDGCFAISHQGFVRGKRILLIDDIYTTGATVNECAQVLLDGGAASVVSLTAAIVNHDN